MQLTCLVTGSGNQSKRWWCSLLSWIMSAFIIFYSIIIVVVSVQSLVLNKETFKSGANNFIREYPGTYPFNTPAAMNNIHTLDVAEDGMPVHNSFVPKTQYLINESLVLEGFEDEEKIEALRIIKSLTQDLNMLRLPPREEKPYKSRYESNSDDENWSSPKVKREKLF
jgi:hypothetical protein